MLKRTDVVVTLAAIIMLMATSVSANVGQAILTSEKAQDLYLEAVIMARFHDPLMLKIAGCESTGNPNLILH